MEGRHIHHMEMGAHVRGGWRTEEEAWTKGSAKEHVAQAQETEHLNFE